MSGRNVSRRFCGSGSGSRAFYDKEPARGFFVFVPASASQPWRINGRGNALHPTGDGDNRAKNRTKKARVSPTCEGFRLLLTLPNTASMATYVFCCGGALVRRHSTALTNSSTLTTAAAFKAFKL